MLMSLVLLLCLAWLSVYCIQMHKVVFFLFFWIMNQTSSVLTASLLCIITYEVICIQPKKKLQELSCSIAYAIHESLLKCV